MHVRVGELQEINQMSHTITRKFITEKLDSMMLPIGRIWTKAIADLVEYIDGESLQKSETIEELRQQRDELLSAALFLSLRLRSKLTDDTEARPGDRVALLEFDQVRQRIEEHRRINDQ